MSFRQVCGTQAWSALLFGVLLLATPGLILRLLAVPVDASTALLVQVLGGMLFALGATLHAVKAAPLDGAARTRIAVGNATCDGLVGVLFAVAAGTDRVGPLGWLFAVLFGVNVVTWLVTLRDRG